MGSGFQREAISTLGLWPPGRQGRRSQGRAIRFPDNADGEADYAPAVTTPDDDRSHGSRTVAYLLAGALATIPVLIIVVAFTGWYVGLGAVVVMWTSGIVWLLKKRQEDPAWDHRPTSGHR
jgi:hypothetical protein